MLNHVYRVIFNRSTGCYMAVSELTKSGGKSSRSGTVGDIKSASTSAKLLRRQALAVAIGGVLGLTTISAQALVCVDINGNDGNSTATGATALACGNGNEASGIDSTAVGRANRAEGQDSTAVGSQNSALSLASSAIGYFNTASGALSTAVGAESQALGTGSSAIGSKNRAVGGNSSAIGARGSALSQGSVSIGSSLGRPAILAGNGTSLTSVNGIPVTATGTNLQSITAVNGITLSATQREAFINSMNDSGTVALGLNSTAIGSGAAAIAERSVSIGSESIAQIQNSVALGAQSVTTVDAGVSGFGANGRTDAAWQSTLAAVSVGNTNSNLTRQITGVAAGTADTDAVNVAQLKEQKTRYVSINSNATGSGSNFDNDGAQGDDSIAIGQGSSVANGAYDSNAIGTNSSVNAAYSNAYGRNSSIGTFASNSNAFGAFSSIGQEAYNSNAFGRNSTIGQDAAHSNAFGTSSSVSDGAYNSNAFGANSQANDTYSTALGDRAIANAESSVALGAASRATIGAGVSGFGANGKTDAAWRSTLGAVSVGDNSDANNILTRQITGVAAGTTDTDAVNVAQLKEQKTRYVSINSTNQAADSNFNNDGATGTNAMAIGVNATASNEGSVAVGSNNQADGYYSSAIGSNNQSQGAYSIASGASNTASGDFTQAIGSFNTAEGNASLAVGSFNKSSAIQSLALGFDNQATKEKSSAIGYLNTASGATSSAMGSNNTAIGADSSALGFQNEALGTASSALGHNNQASGDHSSAVGTSNTASQAGATAIGSGGINDITLVPVVDAVVQTDFTIATTPIETNFDGRRFKDDGNGGQIFEFAEADYELLSIGATASGVRATAIGNTSVASERDSLAMGTGSTANIRNSIALGAQSATTIDAGVSGFGANGRTDATWQSTLAAVSVGDTSDANNLQTRQITGVAAGTTDTDAVNIAQLKRVETTSFSQLNSVASSFGGGAQFNNGVFQPPTYTFGSTTYNDVGSAFSAVDGRLTILENQGVEGDSAYEVAVNNGFNGTETEWLASLKGDQGERGLQGIQGVKGDKGDKGNQGIQGVKGDTGAKGDQGIQGVKGDTGAKGDQGIQGVKGDTGAKGDKGDQGLQGIAGQDGVDGDSAYEVAFKADNSIGSKEEWFTSLKGEKGDSGISKEDKIELENKIEESTDRFVSVNTLGNEDEGNYNSEGATAEGSIAIGVNTKSSGNDSIAIGTGNTVTGNQSTSVGKGNIVSGDRSGAFGDPNIVGGNANYAVGNDNIIGDTTSNSVILGSNATVGATAATVDATGKPVFTDTKDASNSVAIGESVNVQAKNSVAIGANSRVTHSNSVALGANSQTNANNTVSVGSANNQRRITNVAAGINPNDAVNVSQLNQNRAEAFGYTERRIDDLKGETHSAVAGALAFGALRYPNVPGKVSVGLGGGTWEGETGYAVGIGYTTPNGMLSISSAFGGSGSQNGGNIGVSYTFD